MSDQSTPESSWDEPLDFFLEGVAMLVCAGMLAVLTVIPGIAVILNWDRLGTSSYIQVGGIVYSAGGWVYLPLMIAAGLLAFILGARAMVDFVRALRQPIGGRRDERGRGWPWL